jgi:hypothetical protein
MVVPTGSDPIHATDEIAGFQESHSTVASPEPKVLDRFMPTFDVCERFSVSVQAPPAVVYRVATEFDMQAPWVARSVFRLRDRIMGSQSRVRKTRGLVAETQELGWACLEEYPNQYFVAGSFCQPWKGDVVFTPLSADQFLAFVEPGQVKIAWTIETIVDRVGHTLLATETRAIATDADARDRFFRYWRWAKYGILMIRWTMLPAIRRAAEKEWRDLSSR